MKKITSIICALTLCFLVFFSTAKSADAATVSSVAGRVVTSSGRLNIRSGSSTASSILSSVAKGGYITLISKSGNWWYVEYAKGKYGYAYADYIETVSSSPATVTIQSGTLNVRSGAGTGYSVIGSLASKEVVLVLSTSNGWSKVIWGGAKTGYVSNTYLSSNTYSAVSLKLPYYKQSDSRWANATLGSSNKTIAESGCTTTAIAMMESYRTGTTIYPDAMAKKLKYTSGGSVYWPSNYTATTSSSGYLKTIYNLLKQGKPVLFGSKKSTGGQHWVVITGYNGSSNMTASAFSILDPGTTTRTNLQQHLNYYPNFYKYFHYN